MRVRIDVWESALSVKARERYPDGGDVLSKNLIHGEHVDLRGSEHFPELSAKRVVSQGIQMVPAFLHGISPFRHIIFRVCS
jgi:hypothetical protein